MSSGGAALVPAVPGLRLEVQPGSARFPDGSSRGTVTLAAAGLDPFPGPAPDGSPLPFAAVVLPEGVRFDPPARLVAPSSWPAGREVVLLGSSAEAGGFLEEGRGRVRSDFPFVESLPGLGVTGGGVAVFAAPGPGDAGSVAYEGRAAPGAAGLDSVPQRAGSAVVGEGVYAHSGELFIEAVDLTIAGRGIDYRFRRRYESRHAFRGSLGWNWEHEYADRRLRPVPGTGNLLRADGRGSFDEYLLSAATGKYLSPLGVFSRLFRNGEGEWVERDPDGTRWTYHPLDSSPLAGRLLEVADAAGNRLTIERDAGGKISLVRDTLGRAIVYHHDAQDRIRPHQDFTGRTVAFTYDARGDLVSVTGPAVTGTPNGNDFPSGRTTSYEYSGGSGDARIDHNLLRVFAPDEAAGGPPRLQAAYDEDPASPTFDRVLTEDAGGTNASGVAAGGRFTFTYRIAPAPADDLPLEEALLAEGGSTEVTDPRGLRSEVLWNRLGLPTRLRRFTRGDVRPRDPGSLHPGPGVDPPFFETRWSWTAEGLLAEVVSAGGSRTVYEYDGEAPLRSSRGAAARITRHPAPGAPGDGRPRVTTFVRDPLFDRVVREVGPPGNDPEGPPDAAERFAATAVLDYQEGSDPDALAAAAGVDPADLAEALAHAGLALGLGDVNGDGDVSQAAGNPVLVLRPPATLPDGSVQECRQTFAWDRTGRPVSAVDPDGAVTRWRYHPETDPEGDGVLRSDPGLDPQTGGYLAEVTIDTDGAGGFPPARLRAAFVYDAVGDVTRRLDGQGNAVFFTFNSLRELVEVKAPPPLSYRRRFGRDANGNLTELLVENVTSDVDGTPLPGRDPTWFRTTWTYDILDRPLVQTRELAGGATAVTRWTRDEDGNAVTVTRPEGDEERWAYDERNLPSVRSRGGGTGLDPGGEPVDRYDFDEDGALVRVTSPDADGDGEPEVRSWVRSGLGEVAAAVDPAGAPG